MTWDRLTWYYSHAIAPFWMHEGPRSRLNQQINDGLWRSAWIGSASFDGYIIPECTNVVSPAQPAYSSDLHSGSAIALIKF